MTAFNEFLFYLVPACTVALIVAMDNKSKSELNILERKIKRLQMVEDKLHHIRIIRLSNKKGQ